ncbi:phospholipase patatin family [Catenibacterium sp. CAG:290]|uniref:patatin-like phospholipase family protein n=1 Tax=Catenibacterium sp. CAG:290 TaxID=1262767 RepID=UPI00033C136B|nr:patatin family protein [Catenibacterium sp. CAG:290]CDE27592.1 phospholipase patatin family [Catenibacterium sp. CAG:290]
MSGIVLEGGTFRPIFSCGIMDCLNDHDIMFDYCIGVSAGITDGVSYVSKQPRRNLEILKTYRHDPRYIGLRNYKTDHSLFGLKFAYETMFNELNPFDYDTFYKSHTKVLVGVTNANTGKAEYIDGHKIDRHCTVLKATCAIPIVFPAIKIGENEYFDGGIADSIPVKKAIEDGNKKLLIILTRPKGYKKTLNFSTRFAAQVVSRKYPLLKDALLSRHIKYNETLDYIDKLEKEGKALVLRPTEEVIIDSMEKDLDKIQRIYDYGYVLALEHLEEIKTICHE